MICHLAFSFIAYNISLDKVERVKIYNCETKYKSDIIITKPKNRECGFNLIDGEKYWYCFIRKGK